MDGSATFTASGGGNRSRSSSWATSRKAGEEERSEKLGGEDDILQDDVYADMDGEVDIDGESDEDGDEEEVRKDRDPPPGCVRLR